MPIGITVILTTICMVCRGIIFKKRDYKWWYTLIPGLNKYKLGKLVNSKKLAIWNCILHTLTYLSILFYMGLEFYMVSTYAESIQIPKDGVTDSTITIQVPESLAHFAMGTRYVIIAIGFITLIVWCMMMWRFTIQHKRNPWWIILWAVVPVIPYIAFAASPEVVINGKRYKLQRVEVK